MSAATPHRSAVDKLLRSYRRNARVFGRVSKRRSGETITVAPFGGEEAAHLLQMIHAASAEHSDAHLKVDTGLFIGLAAPRGGVDIPPDSASPAPGASVHPRQERRVAEPYRSRLIELRRGIDAERAAELDRK